MIVIVVLAGGCRALTGRTMERWATDQNISTDVKGKLTALRGGGTAHVKVDTYEGTVYLSGIVESEEMRRRAEALARSAQNVGQVVTNLQIRNGSANGSASPPLRGEQRAQRPAAFWHPMQDQLTGLKRIEGDVLTPQGPFAAYDRNGRLVATIYTVAMRDLADRGLDDLVATGRRIDHVAIYSIPAFPDVPHPQYHVVLWHVSRAEAAALR
jgi:hypothetical protein